MPSITLPAAIAIGGGVAGAGAIGGALINGQASSNAANTASQTAAANNALQLQIYNQNTANETPFMQEGQAAGSTLAGLLGTGGDPAASQSALSQYLGSSNYQFQFGQGENALEQSKAAQGLLGSGSNLKAIASYGQNEAQSAISQYESLLAGQQGVGLSATNALAGVGTGYANAVGGNNNSAASASINAGLAGAAGTTNALNGGLASALSAYQNSASMGSSYAGEAAGWSGGPPSSLYTPPVTVDPTGGFGG